MLKRVACFVVIQVVASSAMAADKKNDAYVPPASQSYTAGASTSATPAAATSYTDPATGVKQVTMMGNGSISCGDWMHNRRKDALYNDLDRQWVLGYVTGASAAFSADLLKNTSQESILGSFDQICTGNETLSLAAAAAQVVRNLIK